MVSVIAVSSMISLSSCKDEGEDYSVSWIRFTQDDKEMQDTIHANLNDNIVVLIRTQSNNCRIPNYYKKVDNGDSIEITNNSNELSNAGEYFGEAYKEVRELSVHLSSFNYHSGQRIKYTVIVGTRIPEIYTFIEKSIVIIID